MKMKGKVTQIGMDLHKSFSRATARDADNGVVWRQRLDHTDRVGLRQTLASWPAGTPVIMESTFGWGWMSDEVAEAGLRPYLANSRKVAAWREARGLAKNNKIDADLLSELWSQRPAWWKVWLAPPAVRQQREWLRYRMGLVKMQTMLKCRIHATLHRHGIPYKFSDLFGVAGRHFLNALTAPKDITLCDSARQTLKGHLQLLDHVRRQIARATRQYRKELKHSAAGRRLQTLPGISWILAYTILAEIGDIRRFKNGKHLASYSLLAPRADDSGNEDDGTAPIGRRVGRVGRRTLKWAFIEAARGAKRKDPRFREIFDRRTVGGTRDLNRGYITVANALCRVGYAVLSKEQDYREEAPARPGSRSDKCTSRPEGGQPDRPMVGVC